MPLARVAPRVRRMKLYLSRFPSPLGELLLVGYAGGLHRKRWLLEHEGALAARTLPGF